MAATGPPRGPASRMDDDDSFLSRIQPGPLIAALVLIAALAALALIDRGPGSGGSAPPAAGMGPAVQLLPQGRSDASAAQYGAGGRRGTAGGGR
jgi:hypothetical protein